MQGNREVKSDTFSLLLGEPEYALEVYNCLNKSNYTDAQKLTILTLERGISLSVKNDAAFQKTNELERAIEMAIDACIKEEILADFFRKHRAEVVKQMVLDLTYERWMELEKRDSFQEGKAEGHREGQLNTILEVLQMKGDVPEKLKNDILAVNQPETVNQMIEWMAQASTVEEFSEKFY